MHSMISDDTARFLLAVARYPLQGNLHLLARPWGVLPALRQAAWEGEGVSLRLWHGVAHQASMDADAVDTLTEATE